MKYSSKTARHVVLAIAVSGMLGLAACGNGKPAGLGDLEKAVTVGVDGAWTASIENNKLTLVNTTSERAVRTYRMPPVEGETERTVGVDIAFADAQATTMAGLVLAHKPQHYTLALLTADGNLKVLVREPTGFQEAFAQKVELESGANRIEAHIDGDQADLRVNGKSITTQTIAELSTGNAGIAAVGLGSITFASFEGKGYKLAE